MLRIRSYRDVQKLPTDLDGYVFYISPVRNRPLASEEQMVNSPVGLEEGIGRYQAIDELMLSIIKRTKAREYIFLFPDVRALYGHGTLVYVPKQEIWLTGSVLPYKTLDVIATDVPIVWIPDIDEAVYTCSRSRYRIGSRLSPLAQRYSNVKTYPLRKIVDDVNDPLLIVYYKSPTTQAKLALCNG
jgi:hypothetical protein